MTLVLGIETSCDETGVALVEHGHQVLASLVASQIERHAAFGGVVPEVAAREHLSVLAPLVEQVFTDTKRRPTDLDAIAVTQGPGLVGCLLVGASFAKGMALRLNKPLIPVNHLQAHLFACFLGSGTEPSAAQLPALGLIVTGGHTCLYLIEDWQKFQLLGTTMDDACGEAFDKVAKLLGLGYPGGPVVETWARGGTASRFAMPRVLSTRKDELSFSYSGLKTAVVQHIKALGEERSEQDTKDLCAAFQEEALEQICRRLEQAMRIFPKVGHIFVAGGVAANKRFRAMISSRLMGEVYFPRLEYCSDNGAMIAVAGHCTRIHGRVHDQHLDWEVFPRQPLK